MVGQSREPWLSGKMGEKDYYSVLHLSRQSSQPEIKHAFRQLAMRFHPDKHENDQHAAAVFREIHEAYQVLSHPAKRAAYDQRQWYAGNHKAPLKKDDDPTYLLQQVQKLSRYINRMHSNSIDRESLAEYMGQLVAGRAWKLMQRETDSELKSLVLNHLIKASAPLSYRQFLKLADAFLALADGNQQKGDLIEAVLKQKRFDDRWDAYRVPSVMLISILLCLLIFFLSR